MGINKDARDAEQLTIHRMTYQRLPPADVVQLYRRPWLRPLALNCFSGGGGGGKAGSDDIVLVKGEGSNVARILNKFGGLKPVFFLKRRPASVDGCAVGTVSSWISADCCHSTATQHPGHTQDTQLHHRRFVFLLFFAVHSFITYKKYQKLVHNRCARCNLCNLYNTWQNFYNTFTILLQYYYNTFTIVL